MQYLFPICNMHPVSLSIVQYAIYAPTVILSIDLNDVQLPRAHSNSILRIPQPFKNRLLKIRLFNSSLDINKKLQLDKGNVVVELN